MNSQKQTGRKPCPICRTTDFRSTVEDVTPLWARKILSTLLSDPAKAPPRTQVRICSRCNAELNSKFENPCKPIIERLMRGEEQIRLTAEEMTLASAWMVKTTLVRVVGDERVTGDDELVDFAREELLELMRTGVPAEYLSVRIGYFSMEIERPSSYLLPPPRPFIIPLSVLRSPRYTATPSLHCLKWELLTSLARDRAPIDRLAKVEADADRLIRIWPIPDSERAVVWPPQQYLTMAAVRAHRNAWNPSDHTYYAEKTWRNAD